MVYVMVDRLYGLMLAARSDADLILSSEEIPYA
jgi:hypothetical protein